MDLLVNARGEPRVGNALELEIPSADAIDLLCAFVRWNGLRILDSPLRKHLIENKRRLRVITTVYTGSTERRALDLLDSLGAEVRVSYDTKTTRLHAKAWLFHRQTGFSTAYVGSSNLSRSALLDGVEWNVRLSEVATPELITKFQATFDSYWNDPEFEPYNPERDAERFDRAISAPAGDQNDFVPSLDIRPYAYQAEILEKLEVERKRHGRFRNLIVAATGTGKTIIAALDYQRQCTSDRRPRLLFVAHRRELLTQSRAMFRMVLRDGSFGELYVDGHRPDEWQHVFASIQSLAQIDLETIDPTAFEIVIVDEFHHAAAPTYAKLLNHVRPGILLGLTATPERADGQTVLEWFDGRIAAELRLWEALERGLLCPFQYFGLHDNTDLTQVRWSRRGYDTRDLENLYTADHARARFIVQALRDKVADVRKIRALGFCVSVAHAKFMADQFNRLGVPAQAVSSESSREERDGALKRLRSREVNVVFSVDLYNEGVDIPEIDTVLFLRPTESATIFLQQLGRGLRHAVVDGKNKDCLTAFDFIGHAHRNFRFELRFRAVVGAVHTQLRAQIANGFPYLPAGCSIQLDRVAKEIVLENLQQALGGRFQSLIDAIRPLGPDVTLGRFLADTGLEVEDLYRSNDWSWTRLRREAGFPTPPEGPSDRELLRGARRLIHHDDPERLRFFREIVSRPKPPAPDNLAEHEMRMLIGLGSTLHGTRSGTPRSTESLERLWNHPAVLDELSQLFGVLEDRATHLPHGLDTEMRWRHTIPLSIHSRYNINDVFAAFGPRALEKAKGFQAGVFYEEETRSDLLFVTLEKTEKHYSPTTMYRDYAIAPDLFHWESQSTTSLTSRTGQRYLRQREAGTNIFLFVRRVPKQDGRTEAYTFLGAADFVSHERERPIQIIWKLRRSMPSDFFREAKIAAG